MCHHVRMTRQPPDPVATKAAKYLRLQQEQEAVRKELIAAIKADYEQNGTLQAEFIRRTGLSRETVRKMERAAGILRR